MLALKCTNSFYLLNGFLENDTVAMTRQVALKNMQIDAMFIGVINCHEIPVILSSKYIRIYKHIHTAYTQISIYGIGV